MNDGGGVELKLSSTHEQEPEALESRGKTTQLCGLLHHACIGAVVSGDEAFTHAMPSWLLHELGRHGG